jgi:hypothetical protein
VAEQKLVRDDAEERCVSYAFLRQSGIQHGNLKVYLQNDFTTVDNCYPKDRHQTLHLLYTYSKTVVPKVTQSEGTSFPRKAVEAVVEATMVMEKAMSPALMIKSTGRIRSVTNATIWGILQHIAERSQTPMMMTMALQQRRLTVSRSCRRTSCQGGRHSRWSTPNFKSWKRPKGSITFSDGCCPPIRAGKKVIRAKNREIVQASRIIGQDQRPENHPLR